MKQSQLIKHQHTAQCRSLSYVHCKVHFEAFSCNNRNLVSKTAKLLGYVWMPLCMLSCIYTMWVLQGSAQITLYLCDCIFLLRPWQPGHGSHTEQQHKSTWQLALYVYHATYVERGRPLHLSAGSSHLDNCSRTQQGCIRAILRLQGKTLQEHLRFHVIAGSQVERKRF